MRLKKWKWNLKKLINKNAVKEMEMEFEKAKQN